MMLVVLSSGTGATGSSSPAKWFLGLSLCPRLVAAILSVARKQYSLLKAANLLTPDMVSEFEELERLVHQEAGVSLEQVKSPNRPAEISGATPAPRMQQGCDGEDLDLG